MQILAMPMDLNLNISINLNNLNNINITSPTQITYVGATILDQILTSTSVNVTNCRVGDPFHKSDHCSIYCNTSLSCNYHDSFNRNIWDFKKADWAGLRHVKDYLHFYDWDTSFLSEDVNVWTEQCPRAHLEIWAHKSRNLLRMVLLLLPTFSVSHFYKYSLIFISLSTRQTFKLVFHTNVCR